MVICALTTAVSTRQGNFRCRGTCRPLHTFELLSVISSDSSAPRSGEVGSPTSTCHLPVPPRVFFSRHFLPGEERKKSFHSSAL